MATYQTIIGNTDFDSDENGNGNISIASQRLHFDLDLAEELAEHWANRLLGREHEAVGTLNYIAVRKHNEALDTWETLSEHEC
jgi:hypothetical protein